MWANYIKVAWRNLTKRKFHSIVMLIGLSVGLAFGMIIWSFVHAELQVNKGLRNVDRQYILTSQWAKPNMGVEFATLGPLATSLKENYPDLVENAYSYDAISAIISNEEKVYNESVQLGDAGMLEMYGFQLLFGDPSTALVDPNTMVIPSQVALKYFGRVDVVNEILNVESFSGQRQAFRITGVLDDFPYNSVTHLVYPDVAILMSKENLKFFNRYDGVMSWTNPYVASYVELKEGIDPEYLKQPIQQLVTTHSSPEIAEHLTVHPKSLETFYLEDKGGNVKNTIQSLLLIGLFILIIAVVNYVNISIGNASERMREMGIRKSLGGLRSQIAGQLLVEAMILTGIAYGISLVSYEYVHVYFEELLGKPLLSISEWSTVFLLSTFSFALIVGVLAGWYPSWILSSQSTVDALKGNRHNVTSNVRFRRVLMAGQFAISLFVICATFIVSDQIKFLFNKDLGYDKDQIVHVRTPRDWSPQGVQEMITLRNELERLPEIKSASLAFEIPDGQAGFNSSIYLQGQDSTQAIYAPVLQTDENFLETYDIPISQGRFFRTSSGDGADITGVVINEAAAEALGFQNTAEAVNAVVNISDLNSPRTVIGVVKDFHFKSMHEEIKPVIMANVGSTYLYRFLAFKVSDANVSEALATIEDKWKELMPNAPFVYEFLDITLQHLYQAEKRMQKAAQIASILSLIIVIIGVMGLVSISISRKAKEVGIRKVLGASILDVNWIFIKEFLIITLIAFAMISPMLIYFSSQWLQQFAYRVEINYWYILIFGMIFCLIIASVVTAQIYREVRVNPSESLRTE